MIPSGRICCSTLNYGIYAWLPENHYHQASEEAFRTSYCTTHRDHLNNTSRGGGEVVYYAKGVGKKKNGHPHTTSSWRRYCWTLIHGTRKGMPFKCKFPIVTTPLRLVFDVGEGERTRWTSDWSECRRLFMEEKRIPFLKYTNQLIQKILMK